MMTGFNWLLACGLALAATWTGAAATGGVQKPLRGSRIPGAKLAGHVGEALERHFENAIAGKDADALAAVHGKERFGKKGPWASEFWGKWLMTAAPAYEYGSNAVLKAKIDRTVDYVLANQHANGYIGDVPPKARKAWDIWCRKYTIFGLLEHHRAFGDPRTLKAACRLADELMTWVGPGKTPISITGSNHAMGEMGILQAFVRLARVTGERKYADYCRYIAEQMESGPKTAHFVSRARAGVDAARIAPFQGTHNWMSAHKAFEFSTCYIGLLDWANFGGDEGCREAALKMADSIARTEIQIVGSGACYEMWCRGAEKQTLQTRCQQEGCTKTMWMHFCRELLETTGDPRWADEFERTLLNTYLASLSADGKRFLMYVTLAGRRGRDHRLNQSKCDTHCCNELGPHGLVDLLRSVALTDGDAVYVAQYVPGRVTVGRDAGDVEIVQETDYPLTGKIKLTVNPARPGRFALKVRVPGWVEGGRASWRTYERDWSRGDTVELDFPLVPRVHEQNGHLAFTVGPITLARDTRYGDGDINEGIRIRDADCGRPQFRRDDKPHPGRWISYVARFDYMDGLNKIDDLPQDKEIRFCDFSSAANTWSEESRCRVWCPTPYTLPRRTAPCDP